MKIVWTDNFNRDKIDERLVAEGFTDKHEATICINALQSTCDGDSPDWYKLVEDDYQLRKFEP